jgi:hypothetical protein
MMSRTLLIAGFLLVATTARAQTPRLLSVQSVVTNPDGSIPPDSTYEVVFALWDAEEGGEMLWSETQEIQFLRGILGATLGTSVSLDSVAFDGPRWLSVRVEPDLEAAGRILITGAPSSFPEEP